MNAVIYFMMSVFDLVVLGAFLWLISEKGWDPWWMLLAVTIIGRSNPKGFLKRGTGK